MRCASLVFFFALFLVISTPVFGVANVEMPRKTEKVFYDPSTSVEISCGLDNSCNINVALNGRIFKLPQDAFDSKVRILPSQAALLFSGKGSTNNFDVQFEIECEEYSEVPPVYMCIAIAHVEDGVLSSVSTLKRTYTDQHMGRVSFDKTKGSK